MFSVKFVGSNSGFTLWKLDTLPNLGSFNTGPTLPPDTYTVSLYKYQAFAPDSAGTFLGDQTVLVSAGQSVLSNFDLERSTGLVKGSVTINGTATAGYIQFCGSLETDPCSANTDINNPPFDRNNGSWNGFGSGGFSIPVLPGAYRVHVITSSRSEVGIMSVTIVAGQINTNLTFLANQGSVSGTIKWGEETPSTPFQVRFTGSVTGYSLLTTASNGSINTGFVLPPDDYEVAIYKNQYGLPDNLGLVLLSRLVTVGAGQTVIADFDLSETTGLVMGNLHINDSVAGGYLQFCGPLQTDPCSADTNINNNPFDVNNGAWDSFNTIGVNNGFIDQGGFKIAVAPGNYRVHVITLDRAEVNILPVTVISGAVNDLAVNSVSQPSIVTTSLPAITVGANYSQILQTTDGAVPFHWSLTFGNLPTGLNLDDTTGIISGTSTVAGTYDFTVKVTDANSQTATQDLTIVVYLAPTVDTTSLLDATVSASYSQTLSISGGMNPLSWNISSGALPDGFTLDVSTGTIFGTTSAAGTSTFTAQVADASGILASREFNLIVNDVPTITTTSLATGTVGAVYSQLVGTSGGSSPITWSVGGGSLSPGLNLNSLTGEISGTPTSVGSSSFTIEISDANGVTTTQPLIIVINPAVSITASGTLADATVGATYSQTVLATGGTSPLTWSIFSGSLPDGLSLNLSIGTISGTPTVAGTFNFVIRVVDTNNQSATQTQSINVNPSLAITTTVLPDATVSGAYLQVIVVTGGTPALTWSIIGGNLPNGLFLNSSTGIISGTPTVAGTFMITVQVSDAYSVTAFQALSLTVNATPVITKPHLPDKKVGKHYSQSINVAGGTDPITWSVLSGNLPNGLSLDSVTGVLSGTPITVGMYTFMIGVIDANSVSATRSYTAQITN